MTDPAKVTRPLLAVYVAWHPSFQDGENISRSLFQHYRRDLYRNVAGGSGLPVMYRSQPPEGQAVPIDIDLNGAEATAIIFLVDENWTGDADWMAWARRVSDQADQTGLRALVFPVAIDNSAIAKGVVPEQAVRWDKWSTETESVKLGRLVTALSYQFCRMMRHFLEHLERPGVSDDDLLTFLRKVEVFLSHSKHDADGVAIALAFRKYMQDADYDSFFDVFNIPIGLRFNRVLLEKVRVSAVVAIHTDSYSTREWCRQEMIQAKLHNSPLVVANCIKDIDERGFPYMANVPIVRMDPEKRDRIEIIVARLMDEVLKDFLWRCRVRLFAGAGENVAFLPRPPELIVLTALKSRAVPSDTVVYPDPPIGAEEIDLFAKAAPGIRLLSATEWLAGAAP
ncbi:toll/interleukin-1 receptor domain-containing protein [Bradyrhizobium japonicum]|uniref:toll/interleukin-1 receptor domain-containing protein n=1 Tax=Bradyrhizobium japonicum TaxID=375 RepID=UPI001BA6E724|nr:toll/interleukin-1 receptor domain-containing protein [Bradyrhizobium japonicum]MBR0911467.1 toll/interleukin-1 receptor domain-containing protein [Bradyrhizobium japonicum]